MKTLLFSTLFPSSSRPGHGIFVETRLRELMQTGQIDCKVVAPVPWFPFVGDLFGRYGKMAATPKFERRNGLDVYHPRYLLPPRVGMTIAPYTLAYGAMPTIRHLIANGFDFDVIDAHYYYPDGVAAGLIAKAVGKPFVVTARGSDLNIISEFRHPRKLILGTARKAAASIGVSQALTNRLAALGVNRQKLRTFRNGVDLERFQMESRFDARAKLGLPNTTTLLSVGNLLELKGHHIAIEALSLLPQETRLVIVGTGPERKRLQDLTRQIGVEGRVTFAGQIENQELRWWYSAADILLLCSSREGWANVLLEAMACGTPVIATPVGGTPEVVSSEISGRLMKTRSPDALVAAFHDLISHYPERSAIRKYAEQFSWQETSRKQLELFQVIANA